MYPTVRLVGTDVEPKAGCDRRRRTVGEPSVATSRGQATLEVQTDFLGAFRYADTSVGGIVGVGSDVTLSTGRRVDRTTSAWEVGHQVTDDGAVEIQRETGDNKKAVT